MFQFGAAGYARQPIPPPPPVEDPPQARPAPPPAFPAPRGNWVFGVYLAGPGAVLPVAEDGSKPVPAVGTETQEDAAAAASPATWVMVQKLDGSMCWWRLREDYTAGWVSDTPPPDARLAWYGWEAEDGEHFFQNALTDELSWVLPQNTWPAPENPGEAWIKPGAAVRICKTREPTAACKDLEKYSEAQGVVLCCSGGEGFERRMAYIQLPSELGDRVPQVPAEWLQPLRIGSMVTLSRVERGGFQHLNGAQATVCTGSLEGDDEMHVLLADGYSIRLGIHCMTPVSRIKNLNLRGSLPYLSWRREQLCSFVDDSGGTYEFSVHLPCGFSERLDEASLRGEQAKPWPMLLHMHGAGGQSMFLHKKSSIRSEGFQFAAKTFVVVSPHATWDWKVRPYPWVEQLFKYLRGASWIDPNRCYISGVSMGGMGTWELAASVKDLVAAIAPIAAHHHGGRTEYIAEQLRNVPVLAVSAANDLCCRIGPEDALWRQLLANGNQQLVAAVAPNVEHVDMFDAAYCKDTALYEWLLAHRLGA